MTPPRMTRPSEDEQRRLDTAAIGPHQTAYYQQQFAAFDRAGRAGYTFNPSALIFGFLWFFWRRLWWGGLLSMSLLLATVGVVMWAGLRFWHRWLAVSGGASPGADAVQLTAFLALLLGELLMAMGSWQVHVFGLASLLTMAPSLMGDAWYHRTCRQRIERALRRHRSVDAAARVLAREGGTSTMGVLLSVLLFFALCALSWSVLAAGT